MPPRRTAGWCSGARLRPGSRSRRLPPGRRGKGTVRAERSRFALDADRLVEAVAAEVPEFTVPRQQRQSAVAWLPSNNDGALPSSPLLTEEPVERGHGPDRPLGGPGRRPDPGTGRRCPGRVQGPHDLGAGGDRRQDAGLLGDGPPLRRRAGRAAAVSPRPGRGGRRHDVSGAMGAGADRRSTARSRAAGSFDAPRLPRAGRRRGAARPGRGHSVRRDGGPVRRSPRADRGGTAVERPEPVPQPARSVGLCLAIGRWTYEGRTGRAGAAGRAGQDSGGGRSTSPRPLRSGSASAWRSPAPIPGRPRADGGSTICSRRWTT